MNISRQFDLCDVAILPGILKFSPNRDKVDVAMSRLFEKSENGQMEIVKFGLSYNY